MIFDGKNTDDCQWTVLRRLRLTYTPSNINQVQQHKFFRGTPPGVFYPTPRGIFQSRASLEQSRSRVEPESKQSLKEQVVREKHIAGTTHGAISLLLFCERLSWH